MGIGSHLERRLGELGWDQKRLVIESKLGQQTISAIIRRDSERSKYTAHLAKTVHLSTDQLISGIWPKGDKIDVETDAKTKDREQLLLALLKDMTPEQQEELIPALRAYHAANIITRKQLLGKLKTIGNTRMEREFGLPKKKQAAKILKKRG